MDISIVIVSFNTKKILLDCLDSIKKQTRGLKYEIILVDNASEDGSVEAVRKLRVDGLRVIANKKNLGFAAGNNQGLKVARGKYILFLNSDTIIKSNILKEMLIWLDANPKVGIATCTLRNKNGSLQGTGGFSPNILRVFSWMTIEDIPFVDRIIKPFHPLHGKSFFKNEGFYQKKRELDWVTGAFLLIRKEVINDIGNWDEKYFMYVEEVDLCFRAKKKGWQVFYNPTWSIVHLGGASSTAEFPILSEMRGLKRFYKKFYPAWQYPLLRLFLKLGSLGRIILLGILEGGKSAKIYVQAFKEA